MSEKTNRLYWACRRGMLELDIFLGRYHAEVYDSLSAEAQQCFERLLEQSDPDLFAWLMGHGVPEDPEFQSLCAAIRDHAKTPPSV